MLSQFGYIGVYALVALLVPVIILLLSRFLGVLGVRPRAPSPVKASPYECGMETIGRSRLQYNPRYYLYALLFVVFDIEAVFLYPWAVRLKKLGLFGLAEMLVFILILMVAYIYAWKKRALEWK